MNPAGAPRCMLWLACAGGAAMLAGCHRPATPLPRMVAPSVRSAPAAAQAAPRAPLAAAPQIAQRRQATAASFTNVFAATSWQPPPAPQPAPAEPPAVAAPAPPAAPPLPFRYIGRYGDAESQIVMLVKGEQLYLVAEGDMIDGAYRIERVSGTMVELTYLPLKLKQSLSTGDAG